MFGLRIFIPVVSVFLGFQYQLEKLPWMGFVTMGAVLFAESGSYLARDYYYARRHRDSSNLLKTISSKINPPQLVLKGAWGSYLVAFFFALILMITLEERGWMTMVFAWSGFFIGYYEGALPFYWRRTKWGSFITATSSTWLAFGTAAFISRPDYSPKILLLITGLYVARVMLSWFDPKLN